MSGESYPSTDVIRSQLRNAADQYGELQAFVTQLYNDNRSLSNQLNGLAIMATELSGEVEATAMQADGQAMATLQKHCSDRPGSFIAAIRDMDTLSADITNRLQPVAGSPIENAWSGAALLSQAADGSDRTDEYRRLSGLTSVITTALDQAETSNDDGGTNAKLEAQHSDLLLYCQEVKDTAESLLNGYHTQLWSNETPCEYAKELASSYARLYRELLSTGTTEGHRADHLQWLSQQVGRLIIDIRFVEQTS